MARCGAVLATATLLAVLGCSKEETDGKAVASQAPATEVSTGTVEGGTVGSTEQPDVETRHQQQLENAKRAIPTIADDGTTNAAVKAPAAIDAKVMAKDADTIKEAAEPAAAGGQVTVADDPTFEVKVGAPAGAVGKDGAVKVVVTPKSGWKLNLEFPTKLTVDPPADVSVAKKTQKKDDAVEFSEKKGATWSVAYKPSSAGSKQFSGDLRFAVCTEATCDPKRATVAFTVDVK